MTFQLNKQLFNKLVYSFFNQTDIYIRSFGKNCGFCIRTGDASAPRVPMALHGLNENIYTVGC